MNNKENINKNHSRMFLSGISTLENTKMAETPDSNTRGWTLCHNGFTLIELLVVVLIIGILAAIALPQYQKAVFKSKVTEAVVALNAVAKAEEVYRLANGSYTEDFGNLDIGVGTEINSSVQTTKTWSIKLLEIFGHNLYAGNYYPYGVFIYYSLDDHSFSCCTSNDAGHKFCRSVGNSDTFTCTTDNSLTCYPMNY